SLVGAQAVINGDFFGSGYSTDGPVVHAGSVWGGADHGYVAPLAFGDHRVELAPHEDQSGVQPWMQEVVSGHPTLVYEGQRRNNNGDPLCSNRHPRTAVGLSADKRTLFLAVVDGRASTRIGMTCDELADLLTGLGAHTVMNMDGGGSSTMWMAGAGVLNNPSDGSQRVVGNHLAIYARGSGDAPHCANRAPRGYLDGVNCDRIHGWTQDTDAPNTSIRAHVYIGGPAGSPNATGYSLAADGERTDLCNAIGSCNHAFSMPTPRALMNGQPHEVYAYGIDSAGGANTLLVGSPKVLQCDPPALPLSPDVGVLRHIPNPEVMANWQFDWRDVAVVPDGILDAYPILEPWSDAPVLTRSEGGSAVWL